LTVKNVVEDERTRRRVLFDDLPEGEEGEEKLSSDEEEALNGEESDGEEEEEFSFEDVLSTRTLCTLTSKSPRTSRLKRACIIKRI
jgi:hypothetical protein